MAGDIINMNNVENTENMNKIENAFIESKNLK